MIKAARPDFHFRTWKVKIRTSWFDQPRPSSHSFVKSSYLLPYADAEGWLRGWLEMNVINLVQEDEVVQGAW